MCHTIQYVLLSLSTWTISRVKNTVGSSDYCGVLVNIQRSSSGSNFKSQGAYCCTPLASYWFIGWRNTGKFTVCVYRLHQILESASKKPLLVVGQYRVVPMETFELEFFHDQESSHLENLKRGPEYHQISPYLEGLGSNLDPSKSVWFYSLRVLPKFPVFNVRLWLRFPMSTA